MMKTSEKMKEITLKVPEKRLDFVLELINELGLEAEINQEIPEEHKQIVRERIENSVAEEMIPWEEGKKRIKFKG